MSHNRRILDSRPALALVLALCGACSQQGTLEAATDQNKVAAGRPGEGPAKKDDPEHLVRVVTLAPRQVEERLPCTGTLNAYHGVAVLAPVRGQITEVLVEAGDEVKEGQVLMRIDDREAALNLRAAENREREARNRKLEAELTHVDAEKRLTQARIELEQAGRDLERTRQGREQKLASESALEDAQLAHDKAQSTLALAETSEKLALLGKEKADTELEAATIQRQIRERLLEDYTVRAPIDGILSQLQVKGGEWVASQSVGTLAQNERLLCAVSDQRDLVLLLARPQRELSILRKGQPVEVRVDAYLKDTFGGEIDLLSPDIDPQSGTFTVRVRIRNADGRLRPGMFVRASIVTGVSHEALMIPKTAVVYDGTRAYAFVVRDGVAQRIPVEPGIELPDALEASNRADTPQPDAFVVGDEIVTEGQNKLDTGRKVKVVKE